MFQIPTHGLQRQLKTSEPRFTRLNRLVSHQQDTQDFNITTKSNFPLLYRGMGLDNSKENLSYQTHLMKVRSACKLDETTIVSTYLNSIRKDYDGMSKNSKLQLTNMKHKKREIQFMKMKNKVFTEQSHALELKICQKQKQTCVINDRYEEAKMQTKILDNIIERMKNDQIFYKQFGRIRDEEVKKTMKETKVLQEKLIHQDQKLQKLTSVLNDYKSSYHKNQEQRLKKLQYFAGKIGDVQQRDKFIQERMERTYDLQSIELNDTLDEKNIHMRDIILAHKVANSLLQLKVNNMIKKYSNIQSAFHIVKLKTCISEPQLLVNKFFSYQQTSEGLLYSINQHQRRIEELIQKKAKLAQQYQGIMTQNLSISDGRSNFGFENGSTQRYSIIRDINDKHLLKDQINNWIQKKICQFYSDQNLKDLTIENKFSWLCHNLCQSTSKYQNLDAGNKRPNLLGLKIKKLAKQPFNAQLSIMSRESDELTEINHLDQQHMKLNRQNAIKRGFSIKNVKREQIVNNK